MCMTCDSKTKESAAKIASTHPLANLPRLRRDATRSEERLSLVNDCSSSFLACDIAYTIVATSHCSPASADN